MELIQNISGLADINPAIIALALIWSMVWKGLALWRSATLRQKKWFVAILILNTFGILEIIYLFVVSKKYEVEIVEEK